MDPLRPVLRGSVLLLFSACGFDPGGIGAGYDGSTGEVSSADDGSTTEDPISSSSSSGASGQTYDASEGDGGEDGGGEGGLSGPVSDEPAVVLLAAGTEHTCAKSIIGQINCWGIGDYGALGHESLEDVGDDELPIAVTEVDLGSFGAGVVQLAPGSGQTCALGAAGNVRCWGYGPILGYGSTENLGDDESLVDLPDVKLGGEVTQIAANIWHTCALLVGGGVRCWGLNGMGDLGYGYVSPFIGDDETPADAGDVPIGAEIKALAAGGEHFCAITVSGDVRCWGPNYMGQLGYPGIKWVGDDDTPADLGDVELGGKEVVALALGVIHTCALTDAGEVFCWGSGQYGQLGHGAKVDIGDNEDPFSAGPVAVDDDRAVVQIAAGAVHTCALLEDGAIKCWGYNFFGELGYGNDEWIGDDELPREVGDVPVGGTVQQIVMGAHTCVLLTDGRVRCWGRNSNGELGYGHTSPIGQYQTPAQVDFVHIFDRTMD